MKKEKTVEDVRRQTRERVRRYRERQKKLTEKQKEKEKVFRQHVRPEFRLKDFREYESARLGARRLLNEMEILETKEREGEIENLR